MTPQGKILDVSVTPDGFLYSRIIGTISKDRVEDLREEVATAKLVAYGEFEKRRAKFKSLIDLTQFEGVYVPEAISLFADLMKANKSYIEKSAFFGGGETTTLAANIVTSFADRNNISFFKTKEEAVAWLNS